jgi:hypothetical protein
MLAFLAYCILCTGVHENHFFTALLLGALLAGFDPAAWPLFAAWAVAANLNLWTFYGLRGHPPQIASIVGLSLALAACNTALFALCIGSELRSGEARRPGVGNGIGASVIVGGGVR